MTFTIGSLNKKQILGAAVIVIGIVLFLSAVDGMHRVQEAKSSIDHFTGFFTNTTGVWNPIIEFFGGEAYKKASEYDLILRLFLILGLGMIVFGIWSIFHYKEKR
ncbi:MAG: hypothetical protein JSS09_03195 [Verrucomicrobia bacterium]|nr:hypothetical protein [Verrucomicrobiota bacterium]